jgi:hypothetical protein
VAILNKYRNDKTYKWLLVSDVSGAVKEKKISFGSDGLEYSACISAYDVVNQVIEIKGTGYGKRNEQKSVTGIYKLSGIKIVTGGLSKYGLYLAGDGRNFDQSIDITGDVYVGEDFHFNSHSDNSVIHGSLKTSKNTALQSEIDAPGLVIDSAAYIGTDIKLNSSSSVTFKSKSGIEGKLDLDNTMTCNKEAWFNDTNGGNSKIDMSLNTIHHSGHIKMSRVKDGVEDNTHGTITDIPNKVGLGSVNDSAWKIDVSSLTGKAKRVSGILNADGLQSKFDGCSESDKVNGYMVLIDDDNSTLRIDYSSRVFKGKVIWLFGGSVHVKIDGNWFNMTNDSRMLVYAYGGAELDGFGGQSDMRFNGLIYLTDNAKIMLSWPSGKNYYYGAIHLASKNSKWQINGTVLGAVLCIVYDQPILSEFKSMGILTGPASSGIENGTVILSDVKIRSQLVAKVN